MKVRSSCEGMGGTRRLRSPLLCGEHQEEWTSCEDGNAFFDKEATALHTARGVGHQ